MYAVIRTGGKQYKVAEGDWIDIEKLSAGEGEKVQFEDVLLVGTDDQTTVGTPNVAGASVEGTVQIQGKADKIIVFKYRRRQNYRRRNGHRQQFTRVNITKINA